MLSSGSYTTAQSSRISKLEFIERKKINVNHPIFLEVSEEIDDPYWRNVFIEFAKGKFIKGFTFNGTTLMCKSGTKYIDVEPDESSKLVDFIRQHTAKRSAMDLEREKDAEKELYNQQNLVRNWSDVKSASFKRMLIIDFVSKCQHLYQLTKKERDKLETLICMHLKEINPDIEYSDGQITQIKSLRWFPTTREFKLSGVSRKHKNIKYGNCDTINYVVKPLEIRDEKVSTIKDWEKFMKKFNKNGVRPNENENLTINSDNSDSYMESSGY